MSKLPACCVSLMFVRCAGATKPMRDVKELVKDMNIQFDNLCQVSACC